MRCNMKVCIKENEFNPSLLNQKWCNEKFATEMGYTIVEIEEKYNDCCFEDFNEDLTFNVDKYNARKLKNQQEKNDLKYENKIVSKIRQKYSVNQELAILRQRDTKPDEFAEYNEYVEQCKAEAKSEVLNDNNTIN